MYINLDPGFVLSIVKCDQKINGPCLKGDGNQELCKQAYEFLLRRNVRSDSLLRVT